MQTREGRIAALAVQATLWDAPVEVARYTYDAAGDLVAATDAAGFRREYAYREHKLVRSRNRVGDTTHYRYDGQHRCIETWIEAADGMDASLTDRLPKELSDHETRAKGVHHVRMHFYADGFSEAANSCTAEQFFGTPEGRVQKSVTGGAVNTIAYDDAGQPIAVTNGNGATRTFERDARGRLLRATDAIGRSTSFRRDHAGNVIEVEDPGGGVARTSYDDRGRIVNHEAPDGAVTTYEHDERGLLVEAVGPRGDRTTVEHDAHANPIRITLADGATWRATYDDFGRRLTETDPNGATWTFRYDRRGDRIAEIDPTGAMTRYQHDGEQRLVAEVDSLGHRTVWTYGSHGELHTVTDPLGHVVTRKYDREGRVVEIHNENDEVYRLRYDARGNVDLEQTFDGQTLRFRYDLAGNLVWHKDYAGSCYGLVYNLAGELVRRLLPSGEEDRYTYDALGLPVEISNATSCVRFERDAVGRIVREVQTVGDETHEIETAYDSGGLEVRRRSSLGHVELIERDMLGHAVARRLGRERVEQVYDPVGHEVRSTLPQGGRIDSAYDPAGRLVGRRATKPSRAGDLPAAERRWFHNADGTIATFWDSTRGTRIVEHDAARRLASVVSSTGRSERFRYDAAGNVAEAGPGAPERVYQTGGRLLRRGATEYMWDDSGRLRRKETRAEDGGRADVNYLWNANGLLEAVLKGDGTEVRFTYDGWGRRLTKTVLRGAGVGPHEVIRRVRYVWDGDVVLHAITWSRSTRGDDVAWVRTYAYELGAWTPIAQKDTTLDDIDGGTWVFFFNDAIGTPQRLVRGDGALVADLHVGAWGDLKDAGTDIRFAGQYADEETGLFYNRYRYYDPEIGRYISPDPIRYSGGMSPYAYPCDPFGLLDPFGWAKSKWDPGAKAGAIERARDPNDPDIIRCQNPACGVPTLPGTRRRSQGMGGAQVDPREREFDHIRPRAKGGDNSAENCQVLCAKCNNAKRDNTNLGY